MSRPNHASPVAPPEKRPAPTTGVWPSWTHLFIDQLDPEFVADYPCCNDSECWPSWTDTPVDQLDPDFIDDFPCKGRN